MLLCLVPINTMFDTYKYCYFTGEKGSGCKPAIGNDGNVGARANRTTDCDNIFGQRAAGKGGTSLFGDVPASSLLLNLIE